jgi:hypothetical protein
VVMNSETVQPAQVSESFTIYQVAQTGSYLVAEFDRAANTSRPASGAPSSRDPWAPS